MYLLYLQPPGHMSIDQHPVVNFDWRYLWQRARLHQLHECMFLIKILQLSCIMKTTDYAIYALPLAINRKLANGQEYNHETKNSHRG
jgi:hypothetical protein